MTPSRGSSRQAKPERQHRRRDQHQQRIQQRQPQHPRLLLAREARDQDPERQRAVLDPRLERHRPPLRRPEPDHPRAQRPLKIADTWKDDKTRGRKGKLGRYLEAVVTTKVDGFFREAATNTDLTKLTISESEKETTTAKTGSHEVTKETTTTAYFAHGDRYLHKLVRDRRVFDPGNATTFAGLDVTWTKAAATTVGPVAPPAVKQVQDISDPCHPDYVGGEDCQPGAAPGETAGETPPAPAGDPVPANPPAAVTTPPKAN